MHLYRDMLPKSVIPYCEECKKRMLILSEFTPCKEHKINE